MGPSTLERRAHPRELGNKLVRRPLLKNVGYHKVSSHSVFIAFSLGIELCSEVLKFPDVSKMPSLGRLALLTSSVLSLAAAVRTSPSQTYAACQQKTQDPLSGCPDKTLYVSLNDTSASFQSIQAAIASIPNNTDAYTILIAPGIYTEQLNVTRQGPLTLLGQSDVPARGEAYSDVFGSNATDKAHANDVQIYWNSANFNKTFTDNVYTGVLTVGPTLNATLTGSGPTGFAVPDDTPFGCSDFSAYNIDFRNEQYPYSNGPAHAIAVARANAGFYSCGFYSWQDTVSWLYSLNSHGRGGPPACLPSRRQTHGFVDFMLTIL